MNEVKMKTINDLAKESGLSYSAIRGLCLKRKIIFIRIGTKYMINTDDFYRYLNEGDAGDGKG